MQKQLIRARDHKKTYSFGFIIVFSLLSQMLMASSRSGQIAQWSIPDTIPGLNLDSSPPILVTDQLRRVHAFSSQWVDDNVKAVVYNQWSPEYGWSNPVDILLSPYIEARVTDAYLDESGMMHLIFYGGNNISGDIYYSKTSIGTLDKARSWSVPVIVGETASDPQSAALVADGEGGLNVIFSGKRDGSGLYSTRSKDNGETWSDSNLIFLAESKAPVVWHVHAIRSRSGALHAIWNVYDVSGQGRGIYYASSQQGTAQWSSPVLLAETNEGLGAQTPAIIEYQDTLFALYNITPKITMRRSVDDGLTWDDPTVLFPRHVGVNGSLSAVIDSNNGLHLFFGQRISGSPDVHGMWHSMLINHRWTEPDAVVKGPRIVDQTGLTGFDPYDARAVVSQGNVILVTWRTDPGDIKDNGVWFSYEILNGPELPIATLERSIQDIPTSTLLPIPTSLENNTPQPIFDKVRHDPNPLGWLILGIMAVGLWGVFHIISRRVG